MTLFRNSTHQEVWRQRWCETCFQPDEAERRIQGKDTQCPIWAQALRNGRKPVAWDRMPRNDEMERSIRCNEYAPRPLGDDQLRRRSQAKFGSPNQDSMFDADELHHHGNPETHFVPIEGWPNRDRGEEVDHA